MFKIYSPFSRIGFKKATTAQSFFNNSHLLSFSSRSLNVLKGGSTKHGAGSLVSSGPTRVFSSNIPILQSSFGIRRGGVSRFSLGKYKFASYGSGRRSGFSGRSDTWKSYNKYYGNTPWNKLKGPALFTLLFCTGTTLITPYLFDYTPLAAFKRNPYALILSIIAINGGVFLMWRAPQFRRFLSRYALIYKESIDSYWSFIGAAFSHQSFGHLFVNMFVLHSFGTSLCAMLGVSNFLVLYLNSAVIASFVSVLIPTILRSNLAVGALGASGAIFSVFGAFSYLIPKAPIALFFIPIPGGAWWAFLGAVAYNIAGIAFKFGRYDYAAHIGGSLAGIGYGWWYDRKRKNLRSRRAARVAF